MPVPRPLTISIIQGAFLPVPPALGGAVEKQWFALGQEFARRGHRVIHISRAFPGFAARETIEGVEHRRVLGSDAPSSMLWMKVQDLLYTLRALHALPASDIVVTNTFWAPMVLLASRKGRVYIDFARMPKGQVPLYLKSSRLRVPSRAVARAITESCPAAARLIKVIPNLLALKPGFMEMDAKERSILYAGRIHPEKGIEMLLEAFLALVKEPDMAGWRLDLVGPAAFAEGGGGSVYLAQLQQQFAHAFIRWHGPIYDTGELTGYYARAAIFCYPSVAERGETFGVAPLEAMAWGAVPVVSRLACFEDFIEPGRNGLRFNHHSPGAVTELAALLLELVREKDLRLNLARRALEVWQTHSVEKVATLFLADFEALCGRSRRGASAGLRASLV